MRLRPLYGRGGWWLRQPSDTGEKTIPAILDTLVNDGGGSYFAPKVADGLDFQGANDASFVCDSLADIAALRDYCWSRNIAFLPVVVPRGVIGEAEFHGDIAQACGCVMVDIEPYKGFWDRSPTSLIPVYWKALRAAAGNAYLIAQPDPRQSGWNDGHMPQSLPYFDAICAQHYIGWLAAGWTNLANEIAVFNAIAALGKDTYVTLYAGDPSQPQANTYAAAFWAAVRPRALGWNAFALGPANVAQLQLFQGLLAPAVLPDPIGPQPPKPIPPKPTPPGPTDEWAFRLGLAQLSAANAMDLTDQEQGWADIAEIVTATAQEVLTLAQQRSPA